MQPAEYLGAQDLVRRIDMPVLDGPQYLLLKKQERRRFYRTGAVVLSLIFAAVICLMGVGTRFKNTFFTYATILDTSEKSIDEYTYKSHCSG